jgi:long-chain acyl-CoA synthetase
VNARHARVENIRKWRVLPGALTVANGELTPTLKVKRNVVCDRYGELIREMYTDRSDEAQPAAAPPLDIVSREQLA